MNVYTKKDADILSRSDFKIHRTTLFFIKKDEKACHISKRECYIIIINSERKKKTPPPEKNIINSRADQRREPGFILN